MRRRYHNELYRMFSYEGKSFPPLLLSFVNWWGILKMSIKYNWSSQTFIAMRLRSPSLAIWFHWYFQTLECYIDDSQLWTTSLSKSSFLHNHLDSSFYVGIWDPCWSMRVSFQSVASINWPEFENQRYIFSNQDNYYNSLFQLEQNCSKLK